jgi:hypothetical protein
MAFLSFFSFTKSENRKTEQVLQGMGSFDTTRKGELAGKGCRRVNTMQILYTHVCECKKLIPIETIPGMGEGHKEEWWKG